MAKKKEEKYVDIEGLIKSKNPRLLKWTPRFFINYLKRKIHEDDVNEFLKENEDADGFEFSHNVLDRCGIEVKSHHLNRVPKKGGVILALNHPLGGMDAMALITEFENHRKDFKFVVNDLLMNLKNLRGLFVGVNKHGTNTKEDLKILNDLFAAQQAIFVFPAGLVSRRKRGKVQDLEWKKTFITRAKRYKLDVIPVHIEGELSNFFYRLSNFRRAIGIKANIEMLYLVDELFKQKDKTIELRFGEPIPYSTFDKSKKDLEWAAWVKSKVYQLQSKSK
ncbi:MAG: 1-acyl-sn-glycerol-3-phosphate acyltransferase [Crocinitomicaceae bacterium]